MKSKQRKKDRLVDKEIYARRKQKERGDLKLRRKKQTKKARIKKKRDILITEEKTKKGKIIPVIGHEVP
jgi:hypothetical protein